MVKSVIYLLFSYQTVYNVTFPADDIYSLRLRLREYRSYAGNVTLYTLSDS
jgi:hypothetical protein